MSVRYLDHKLVEQGCGPATRDKAYGARIITYAIVIVNKELKASLS